MPKHKMTKAKVTKNDEWYTRMEDIKDELQHYEKQLEGKVIYCPCDDVTWSNFPRYFQQNFERLKLKALIASCYYNGEQSLYTVLEDKPENKRGYWAEYKGDDVWERHNFKYGNGDFRSDECGELLKRADIVITNPPFSLFREFLPWCLNAGKDFIVLGNQMASQYKDIFPALVKHEIFLGYRAFFSLICFDEKGNYTPHVPCSWYTTFETPRPPFLEMTEKYSEEKYPMLSNYDAILVNSIKDIPCDYYGEMAVPFTFMKYWNEEQFEITGSSHHNELRPMRFLVLKGSEVGRTIRFASRGVYVPDENGIYMDVTDGSRHTCCFSRVLIKRKVDKTPEL